VDQFPWLIIPARGGSREVPRKNLRIVAGKPLITYTIQTALEATLPERVVVITDDDEIDEVSRHFGAQVLREAQVATGLATLDELLLRHLSDLERLGAESDDIVFVMQPTCPLLRAERIQQATAALGSGYSSVITVKSDAHLSWGLDGEGKPKPNYTARLNRQQLPPEYRESGAIIGSRLALIREHGTRIVEPIKLLELTADEALDIDNFSDLAAAEHGLTRIRIIIRADAGPLLGMGHVYRALALAQELARHDLTIVTSAQFPLGGQFFAQYPFNHAVIQDDYDLLQMLRANPADLVVLDLLDTSARQITELREAGASRIVTFEDQGEGAAAADLLVSDLYPNPGIAAENQLSGITSSILAPSFETLQRVAPANERVRSILVLFGGTDPSNLAEKSLAALEAIGYQDEVVLVRGLGAEAIDTNRYQLDIRSLRDVKNMPQLMSRADLALSSAGRTLTELACIGVPVICMAQNAKELAHTHATESNGVVMLGLGHSVTGATLEAELRNLLESQSRRAELRANALTSSAGRSNRKIVAEILSRVGLELAR